MPPDTDRTPAAAAAPMFSPRSAGRINGAIVDWLGRQIVSAAIAKGAHRLMSERVDTALLDTSGRTALDLRRLGIGV